MKRISLINMPFAGLHLPSLGLTQLESVLRRRLGDQVSVEIFYLNFDFAGYFGLVLYKFVSNSFVGLMAGFGDWLFRQAAFPDLKDNSEEYFQRYKYHFPPGQLQAHRGYMLQKRKGLDAFIEDLIAKYNLAESDLIGLTSVFSQNMACFAMARKIKEANPAIVTVMGGSNCESPMGQEIVANAPQIDYVFSGPALNSFPAFVKHWLDGEIERSTSIRGVFSRANYSTKSEPCAASNVVELKSRSIEAIGEELDINDVIELDYDPFLKKVESSFPNKEVEPAILFETSRGCWWGERSHCTFCGLNGLTMAYRSMSSEIAVAQLQKLFDQYSSRASLFQSVDNILPKNYISEVFPFIDPPSHVSIFYEVKSDLSEDDVKALSKARVKAVQPGIESLATSTLKLMKKGSTVFQNVALLKRCSSYDVHPDWNLLVGFPGERADVYKKYLVDIPRLMHLPPPSGVFGVRFDRFSPYFMKAKEYGLDLKPLDFYELTYPFEKKALENLAYYFMDCNFAADYFLDMVEWMDKLKACVSLWSARWFGNDRLVPARLYFVGNGQTAIYDSRSGSPVEYPISSVQKRLLDELKEPRKIENIESRFDGANLSAEMSRLQEMRLLIEENERYMSVVLPSAPPPMTFERNIPNS